MAPAAHQCLRAYLPWICTSLALGYAAYLHWKWAKARKNSKRINKDKQLDRANQVNIDEIDRITLVDGKCDKNCENKLAETCCQLDVESLLSSTQKNCPNFEELNLNSGQIQANNKHNNKRTGFSLFAEQCLKDAGNNTDNGVSCSVEFAKDCAKKWKQLTPEEKLYYNKLAAGMAKDENEEAVIDNENCHYQSNDPQEIQNELIEVDETYQQKNSNVELNSPQLAVPLARKRFSLKGDIDDLAFDIFSCDEMPIIREEFRTSQNRRMSGAEMLDELLRRWENLSPDLKDDYVSKAVLESSMPEQ